MSRISLIPFILLSCPVNTPLSHVLVLLAEGGFHAAASVVTYGPGRVV